MCEEWFEDNLSVDQHSRFAMEIPNRAARIILCFTPVWPIGLLAILKEGDKKRRRRRFLGEKISIRRNSGALSTSPSNVEDHAKSADV